MDGDGLRHALLVETAPGRAFSHLELATPAGLLTLHPEGDGTLHGNVVEAGGIRHVSGLAWEPGGVVDIEGSPIAGAACAWQLALELDPGGSARRPVLRITRDLLLTVGPGTVERLDEAAWRIAGGAPFRVDEDGQPVLADTESWPLERGDPT